MLGLVIERVTGQSYEECILSLLKEIGVEDISVGFTKKIPSHYMEVSIFQELNWHHILCTFKDLKFRTLKLLLH